MPKYFRNKAEMLHAEAFASLLLLEDRWDKSLSFDTDTRIAKVIDKARNRVYRRWSFAFGGK